MFTSKLANFAFTVVLWVYAFISLYPLIYLVFYSLKDNGQIFFTNTFGPPTEWHFENYASAFSAFKVGLYFTNSVIVSASSLVFILVLSLMFSYATSRMRWKGRKAMSTYMTLGLFIPLQIIMIPLALLVRDFHISNTLFALIIPYIAFNLPFSCLIFYGFFRTIPFEMEESAVMDGASIYRTFRKIILPLVKAPIATCALFAFLNVWNEFTIAVALIYKESAKTLPLGLAFLTGYRDTNWGAIGATLVIASVPTVVFYLLFYKQIDSALSRGSAIKG